MFSDESTLQQFVARKRHVRRPRGTRFNEKYTISTMKHPPSQMIWGAIFEHGVAGISFLSPGTTMNGPRYVELLAGKLNFHMAVHNCTIFVQDGAPCHRSKVAKTFLVRTESWFRIGRATALTSTLSRICGLIWRIKLPRNIHQVLRTFVKVIKGVWVKEISQEFCKNLVHSMPQRLQEVIKNGGGSTKY